MKDLQIVIRDFLGRTCLLMIPIPLFAFEVFLLICWLKFDFSSRYKPRCFWHGVQTTGTVLKVVVGWLIF